MATKDVHERWIELGDPTVVELRAVLPANVHDVALDALTALPVHDDESPRIQSHGTSVLGILLRSSREARAG